MSQFKCEIGNFSQYKERKMATYDVGSLNFTPVSYNDYSLDKSDTIDVFEFSLDWTNDINLSLTGMNAGDDADVTLYRDNGNGIFNASEDISVASSRRDTSNDDSINVADQQAGTYFAQVNLFNDSNSDGVSYDLALSATYGASNLLPVETQLGDLSADVTYNGYIDNNDTSDLYAFSLGYFEGVNINLSGLSSDLDIRLIADINGNRIVDSGEELVRSAYGGTHPDSITLDDAGDYFLQVYQFSGNSSYTLDFDHFTTDLALAAIS
jgi:hypothetical protein